MSRKQRETAASPAVVALYAMTHSGLEPVAAEEIVRELGGTVHRTPRGLVIFHVDELDRRLLQLRTTEDVFLLAWGSDTLTYRAADLELIRRWTAKKPDWPRLFRLHHQLRPLRQGKPTFHLVCQMQGEHGYRRIDAAAALREGLRGVLPVGWYEVEENAWLEIWLTIHGRTAVCGVRLSDRTMRHRPYKREHLAASLRPTAAAAMARLAGLGPHMIILDPMCGAGTILAEAEALLRQRGPHGIEGVRLLGGDLDPNAVFVASQNLRRCRGLALCRWDARLLPLADASVDRILCNPPFGKQLSDPAAIGELYAAAAREWDRVLIPGGRAVLLVMDHEALLEAVRPYRWTPLRRLPLRLLGQACTISVWSKVTDAAAPLAAGERSRFGRD